MFRTTRGRQDLLIEMNEFKHQYYDRKKLISLGWKEVETVDGRGINSWNSLKNKLTIEGKGGLVGENAWPKVPLAINNEEIVGLQESLVEGFGQGSAQKASRQGRRTVADRLEIESHGSPKHLQTRKRDTGRHQHAKRRKKTGRL